MGLYSRVDWIQFEWDERRTRLGPVRSSLEDTDTRGWYHQLGPWLDPGPAAGVSVCRLLLEGRVVVLARTRTGGADSRRTIHVQAYLGGAAAHPSAMPNVRQALALAPGWASQLPADEEPLDLARLIDPFAQAGPALDRQARAGAAGLVPIVSGALREYPKPLSVASPGDAVVQLWGLVDVLDLVLGVYPETFSTYESDDLKQGADVIFLQGWPGPSSQGSHRARVDLRAPEVGDAYDDIAAMVVEAYVRGQLPGLVKRLRLGDEPVEERVRRLESATYDPPAPRPATRTEDPWAPRPPARSPAGRAATSDRTPASDRAASSDRTSTSNAGRAPASGGHAPGGAPSFQAQPEAPEPQPQPSRPAASRSQPPRSPAPEPQAQRPAAAQPQSATGQAAPAPAFAARDVFEDFRADLAEAGTAKEARDILKDVRAWVATRQPSDTRSRLPALIPDLERLLPDNQINPILRDLLDPDAPSGGKDGGGWLDRRWLILAALLSLVLVVQIVTLILP
ncbi:hypothetical protein [Nonomuraea insulae]|uniref:Uncharacterized protein n=1 Tax=Nonomuraea insulae TaxID=1616787 RepID=A0ABW1D0H5_9ACTN